MAFRPGDSIAGRYRIEDVIAEGGMGVIYAARHMVLGERVAIKCLLPELSSDAEQTARLLTEARSAARIKSEHVARIIDADRLPDGTVFLAMERLDGQDLDAVLGTRGTLPVDEAIAYVLQAGEALAEAHACGIIHRDLKPANLFAARRPDGSTCIKVLDFGISKVLPHEAQVRTRTGAFMGTPMYASPEQLTTPNDIDRRTDIWALGCVLYELLAGEPPFSRETIGALVAAIVGAPFAPLSARRPDVPAAVDLAIARCLEKDRTRRWSDIAELAAALAPYSPAQAAVSLPRIQALAQPPAGIAFAATESGYSLPAPPRPPAALSVANAATTASARRAPVGPWIVAGVLAFALAGGAVLRRRAHHADRPSPFEARDEVAADAPPNAASPSASASSSAPASSSVAVVVGVIAGTNAPSMPAAPALASASASPTRAGASVRPGARRGTAAPSPGKSDDWKMPIKE